jgi:hypothetical protein
MYRTWDEAAEGKYEVRKEDQLKVFNKPNNHYRKHIFICNYNTITNKNRSSPTTLMIPKSNRRTEMNKLLVNNNSTKDFTNNLNIIFVKIKTTNTNNCPNVNWSLFNK